MKRIIIFSMIVVLFQSLLMSLSGYKYYCFVSLQYFHLRDKTKALEYFLKYEDTLKVLENDIIAALEKAYNDVWNDFESNKYNIKDEKIRNAIEQLRKKAAGDDLLNPVFFTIHFYFDTRFIDWLKKFGFEESTLKKYIIYDSLDVHAGNDGKDTIEIFNGVGDFRWDNFKYVDLKTNCEYKMVIMNHELSWGKEHGMSIVPLWRDESDKKYSIKSALFHELVHIALKDAGIDRWVDDASVEDITLQLYPGEKSGFNLYEMAYDKGLVENKFKYYKDGGRQFNPRIEFNGKKLYYYPDEEIGTKRDGVKVQGLSCDDAISSPYQKFVIPYIKCCKIDGCKPDPTLAMDSSMWINDIPDDNYSFASGIVKEYNLDPEAVIFTRGHWEDALKLFGGLQFDGNNTAEMLLEATPYLIFPTGSLAPMQESAIFKNLIEQYVRLGGVIIIFAQQTGLEVEKLIPRPAGEKLKVYGWREDSSCLRDSVYYTSMSSMVSSSKSEICSLGVDGYISAYPSNSTVLLRRRMNREPALLYYKYGDAGGYVFLTSIFTDAAASMSQASASERKIVRDLITFAKRPDFIPGFDLEINPQPEIRLNIEVFNNTEKTASKAILSVYNPDRETLLYHTEEAINLNAGETGVIPIHFTLPELYSKDYGISHCDYELLDSDNELLRMKTESLSGRFYTFKITNHFTPPDGLYQWITVNSEWIHWGECYEINMHFKNTTSHVITLDVNDPFFCINHCYPPGIPFDAFNVTVAPGEEYEHLVIFPTTDFPPYATGSFTVRIQYYDSNRRLKQINGAKLLFYEGSFTKSSLKLNNTSPVAPGGPLNYSIHSSSFSSIPIPGIFNIKVTLDRYNFQHHRYDEIETLYQAEHNFSVDGSLQYNGTYIPGKPLPSQQYRLKLEVMGPNGLKEKEQYQFFHYDRSGFNVKLEEVEKNGVKVEQLIPGESYTIPVKISNISQTNNYNVKNGKCNIVLRSHNNREIFRREITHIGVDSGEEIERLETFVFSPVETGRYILEYEYTDETIGEDSYFKGVVQSFLYRTSIGIIPDKERYKYLDNASVGINIIGAGNYHIHFTCPEAGIDEERVVQIPVGSFSITELFQIPIGVHPKYNLNVEVKDAVGAAFTRSALLFAEPFEFDYTGKFSEIFARAGSDLHLDMHIKEVSGMTQPLTGQFFITCPQLNYQNIKTVTIQPLMDNPLTETIPIATNVSAGIYRFDVTFTIEAVEFINKYHFIYLPVGNLKFLLGGTGTDYNAGDTLTLDVENTGGKPGHFETQILLKDSYNHVVVENLENLELEAGEGTSLSVSLPLVLKNGRYCLVLNVNETISQSVSRTLFPIFVNGLTASLNSYTLKEKYFDNENVSGKSEITSGSGNIGNGHLRAKIIRFLESSGIEEEKPGDYISYNMIEKGFSSSTKLYLSTDQGLLEYDKATGNVNVLYNFENYNCQTIYQTAGGELWVGTTGGVFRRDGTGTWQQYTTANGLTDNWINDIIEADLSGTPAVWVANRGGISVFSSGSWRSFTTADGLPSNQVYALARDDTGAVWASTSGGVVRYNDTSTTFESVSAPFGTANVSGNLTSTSDGSVWMVYSNTVYRYHSGVWQTWTRSELYPDNTIYIRQIKAIGENVWITSDFWEGDNKHQVLIRYDGVFTPFTNTEVQGLTGLDYYAIMPGNGDEAYFTCEFGFMEYRDGTWSDKEIGVDKEKLSGEIRSMKVDSNGTIWAGTDHGLSMYDGSKWINYVSTPENRLLFEVNHMTIDTSNRVYGFNFDGIIKMTNSLLEMIEFTTELYNLGFGCYPDTNIAVDTSGKVWLGRNYTFYHDGEWHKYEGVRYVSAMENDRANGIWVGSWNDYSEFHLQHIKNDLTLDDYTASNCDLIPGEKDRLYMDSYGILWIKHDPDSWDGIRNLQSFDGTLWMNYTGYEGFPPYGVVDFARDENGKLMVVDRDGNLYALENETFILFKENTNYSNSLVSSNGQLYCAGGEPVYVGGEGEYEYPNHFLKISSSAALIEEEIWGQTYSVNMSAGETTNLDLLTGKNFSVGSYVLKTTLLSSLDQELAESTYPFHVREDGISIVLSRENGGNPYIKAGSTVYAAVEILNNTPDNYTNLRYLLKKQPPSGTVVTLRDLTLSVAAGGSYTDTVTFSESDIGTWHLRAEILDESSSGGGEPGGGGGPMLLMQDEGGEGSGTLLSQSEMILQVAEPTVSMEILSPQYAGDEPFDIKVKLTNDGDIGLVVSGQWAVVSNGEIKLDETITLNPGEERLLTFDDTITSDRSYTFTLSGDVEKSETITVQYGYVENFSLHVLPSYREGTVTIGYTITNGGGLGFSDDLHFELYAVGGTVPLITIERNYNLYPGESPITDAIALPLTPGNYQLKYRTSKNPTEQESPFTVQPSGIGTVSFTGNLYPVGMNEMSYQITNSDTVAGQIPVTVTITTTTTTTTFTKTADIEAQGALPILSETRYYYLEPGQTQEDYVQYEFTQKGNYTLTFTGSKLTTPVNSVIQILNLNEVTANLSVGTPETIEIPVSVDITNSGYNTFSGRLVMEIEGIRSEETINVPTASSLNKTFGFQTAALLPGAKEVNVFLYDLFGNTVSQTSVPLVINSADIKVIEVPENLEIDAGGYADVTLKLKNEGHLRGDAMLKVTALDSLFQEREIALEPGEEIEIENIYIEAPADIPAGHYPFNYTLTGAGVENGLKAGNFNFKVNGISMDVDASFASDCYNVGETAELTITVTPQAPSDAPLEAMVNWGEYSEKQTFNLSIGSQQLVFNIPVDAYREDKVFYGIYHEGGKGIHLNDIYLRFGGDTYMVLDQQLYQPGDIVHAVFTSIEIGELTATSFDESHTVPVSSSAVVDFAVPETTLGGTYGVSWAFTPSDTSHESLSGSISFDVSGLVVKVAHSGLEKGKYGPGETIKATYTFESNRDETLVLHCWTVTPTGEWEYLGENSVTVSAERHVNAVSSYTFNTTEAGTHNLVYGLYREDQLVVSGSMAFDVGDAVLMGITTDHFEYKEGNEPVHVKVDYFGEGTAQIELYLNEELVDQRSLTISGVGSTEIPLASTQVSGGSHSLKVILTKDGLTSTKSTGFIYGTNLPDLTVTLINTDSEGLDYTYTVEVTNSGKTASNATSLVFMDNETAVETVSIPALQSGESHETTFNWSGSGKAGTHELVFEVDNTNTVREFSETNNSLTFTEEVPVVFYTLEVDPVIWPANSDITIITRMINNQNSVTAMVLNLSITSGSSGEVIFERALTEELPAFGSKTISDIFNTGVYPAGEYTLSQTLSSGTVNLEKSISILIETTKAVNATLAIQPQTITADIESEVELTITLTNAGNVPLQDEILLIEVFNKDSEEIVTSEEMSFSIPLAEQITKTKIMTLNLVEGNYEIRLKYLDELLTSADLIVVPGIEGEKKISIKPRVLIMNLHLLGSRSSQVDFLTNVLQMQAIEYEIGHHILDSYVQLHKGHSNVNIVLGNLMGRNLGDELKERVWRGEGLILVCDNPIHSPELVDFLGVNVHPIKGKEREKHITLLPGELSSGGEVELEKKNQWVLIKMKEDVMIVGQTQQKKHPVLAWRKYGNGHILVLAVPLEFKAGTDEIAQLLVNAVTLFSKDVYSSSDLTRILPLELSITNKASEEKSLIVKEIQPYGVEGYDYDPEPEEDENEDKELKWNLKVPGAGEARISYWLKLPDQINIYDIKTEIYEGETLRNELSITFEVSQTVLSRIDELIVEIESMNATGIDERFLRKAVNRLQKIRNRTGDSLSQHLVNLLDSVDAANHLGSVKTIDVSSQRLKTQDIMIIMGRRFYEKVKTWGASKLIPFTRMITGD